MFMGAPLDETKKAKLHEALDWLDTILKGRQFSAADHFTIGDLTLMVTVSQIEAFDFEMNSFKNIKPWLLRCKDYLEPFDYEVVFSMSLIIFRSCNFSLPRKLIPKKQQCWLTCSTQKCKGLKYGI